MFERFTDSARHVMVLAQDEARALQHNYIGTEHLVLGLLREPRGLAAGVLQSAGMTATTAREQVTARVGVGKKPPSGHIPFTPRAKKVLELALREALSLHHPYIGTEHLLLGVIREGEGVGAAMLSEATGDSMALRMAVLDVAPAGDPRNDGRRWRLRKFLAGTPAEPSDPGDVVTTLAADSSLEEAARLAGAGPVGSHHLLLAALSDPDSAAAKALGSLGLDLAQARDALREADVVGTSDERPEDVGRRLMVLRVSEDELTIEANDQGLVAAARSALDALGDQTIEPGVIRGDLAASVSLGEVWTVIHRSLEDIKRRAGAA